MAKNADTTMVSDRMLEQLQHLNEVSLELAYASTITEIFELMNRAASRLMQKNYTKVNIIQVKEGKVLRLQDNTKVRD